ncbi:MAG TPA: methyltransferase [Nocardioides sp.]|jgi:SAM-dependent methyltransferase|uniref:class I SAM-dependent methyltransferase n=1 Tax=Nocardioides sp. TaxID=35761 RepID=UPI002E2F5F9E|nr:methyltransferase [Nocardioides sp.]HEX3930657.1 methyltransferase [Nocardioides sp.]
MSTTPSEPAGRGSTRTAVVWSGLEPVLAGPPRDVLDIGGGTGGLAVRVGALGHRVTVVDPSPDALAALDRRAREHDVEVTGRQGDLSSLLDVAGAARADVVLCHGVLEVAGDPAAALATLAAALRPGGVLSLLVAQRHAAVVARAMAGHFQQALAMLDPVAHDVPTGRSGRRYTHDEIIELVSGAGFTVDTVHAIRVFTDLVPGSLLDLEPGASAALVDLEQAVADRPEYRPLATQLHLLAHRA